MSQNVAQSKWFHKKLHILLLLYKKMTKFAFLALVCLLMIFTLATTSFIMIHSQEQASTSENKMSEQDEALVKLIKKNLEENDVFVFSKSYCPYCRRAKSILDRLNIKYAVQELDQEENGYQVQQLLAQHVTGVRTVPQIFFKNQFFGGADYLTQLASTGELQRHLRSLNIDFTDTKNEL